MILRPSVCSSHSHVLCVSYSFLKRKNQFKNQFKLRHVFIRFYLTNFPPTALLKLPSCCLNSPTPLLPSHQFALVSSHVLSHPTPLHQPHLYTPHWPWLKAPHAVPLYFTHPTHHNSPHPTPSRLILKPSI